MTQAADSQWGSPLDTKMSRPLIVACSCLLRVTSFSLLNGTVWTCHNFVCVSSVFCSPSMLLLSLLWLGRVRNYISWALQCPAQQRVNVSRPPRMCHSDRFNGHIISSWHSGMSSGAPSVTMVNVDYMQDQTTFSDLCHVPWATTSWGDIMQHLKVSWHRLHFFSLNWAAWYDRAHHQHFLSVFIFIFF